MISVSARFRFDSREEDCVRFKSISHTTTTYDSYRELAEGIGPMTPQQPTTWHGATSNRRFV